jgi:dipeptidyl aminopeptidase/acylaminoacyl peptidase
MSFLRRLTGPAVLVAVGCVAAPAWGAARWTPADTQRFTHVGEVRISPDGSQVVFEVERSDLAKNENFSSISLAHAAGGPVLALTEGDVHDHAPRFSPDGLQIAYLSEQDGKTALWVINTNGGGKRSVRSSSNERLPETSETSPVGRRWIVFAGDSRPAQGRTPRHHRLMPERHQSTDNSRTTLVVSAAGGAASNLRWNARGSLASVVADSADRVVTDRGRTVFQMN